MSDLLDLTLCEVAEHLADGRVGAVELLREAMAAVARRDPGINAVIAVEADRAMSEAAALDQLPRDARGALHGVPLAHKDMFHRAGVAASYGSPRRTDRPMERTAPLLRRLDAAGAVSFARLNMAEYAMGPTGHNPGFGRCRNPFDPELISGGSSSGSGAAVAARYAFGALGSDTGGSVRLPAACCGVVGLKPTQGALPLEGVMGLSESLDCPGPLTRSSRDAARLMDVLGGPGHEAATGRPVKGLRIGLATSYYLEGLHPEIQSSFDAAVEVFKGLGVEFLSVDVPDHRHYADLADMIWKPEACSLHLEALQTGGDALAPQARSRLTQGLAISAVDYVRAKRMRALALRDMLDGPLSRCDALLTPATRKPTPRAVEVEAAAGDEMRLNLEALTAFTRPLNFLGLPGLVTPSGLDSRGAPMSIQLIARPGREATLLQLGDAFEREAEFNRQRPSTLS